MDPLNQSSLPPVPASPEGVQGGPTGAQLSQTEMSASLQNMMGDLDGKYSEFQDAKTQADSDSEEQKNDILRQLFDLFQIQGVDPADPEAVKAFLDKIKQENPEVFAQIEKALQSLIGGESATQGMEGGTPNIADLPAEPMAGGPEMAQDLNQTISGGGGGSQAQ